MPLAICRSSCQVKRFLRFHTCAALLGPAEVMADAPVVVTPPPMTIPPGPPFPVTNDRLDGKDVNSGESKLKAARENPTRSVFKIRGEKTWVSWTLATWLRSVRY